MIESIRINSGAAVGADGVATANADSHRPVVGRILSIGIKYNDAPPAGTTDVVIATAGKGVLPALTILTLTNAAASGWFNVRHKVVDEVNAGITYDGTNEVYDWVCIADYVNVKIAQANAADNVDVVLIYERGL